MKSTPIGTVAWTRTKRSSPAACKRPAAPACAFRLIVRRIYDEVMMQEEGEVYIKTITGLVGTEQVFRQLVRHLRALDHGARDWLPGMQYVPGSALSWSCESKATLDHSRYGPMRDFPVPDGFMIERWSYHAKLTGGGGFRLYFRPDRIAGKPVVLVGYFGAHLPSLKYPT